MNESPIVAVGIAWYRAEDYDAARRIMADGDQFPATFHEWRMKAEAAEKREQRRGQTVVRVYIDPETFADWCRARRLNVDAQARMKFASATAKEQAGRRH